MNPLWVLLSWWVVTMVWWGLVKPWRGDSPRKFQADETVRWELGKRPLTIEEQARRLAEAEVEEIDRLARGEVALPEPEPEPFNPWHDASQVTPVLLTGKPYSDELVNALVDKMTTPVLRNCSGEVVYPRSLVETGWVDPSEARRQLDIFKRETR